MYHTTSVCVVISKTSVSWSGAYPTCKPRTLQSSCIVCLPRVRNEVYSVSLSSFSTGMVFAATHCCKVVFFSTPSALPGSSGADTWSLMSQATVITHIVMSDTCTHIRCSLGHGRSYHHILCAITWNILVPQTFLHVICSFAVKFMRPP